jgi:prophage regulatory protein
MRLIRLTETLNKTGLSRSTLYDLTLRGEFPAQVKLFKDGRAVAWIESEIDDWIKSRVIASRGGTGGAQ